MSMQAPLNCLYMYSPHQMIATFQHSINCTPYFKMVATQDGLDRVAWNGGIEGRLRLKQPSIELGDSTCKKSIIYLCGNGQTYCQFRKKKAPKQQISLTAYWTSNSQGFSRWWIPSWGPDSPRSKLFLLSHEVLPQFYWSPRGTT